MKYEVLKAHAEFVLRQILLQADDCFRAELEYRREKELALYRAVRS